MFGNDEAETGCQESPCHVGESKEQKRTATPGVDCPNRRPCEYEIYKTESEGCQEGSEIAGTGIDEHSRGIESNDVDTAHLLSQHDGERSASRTSDTGNREQFDEASYVVALADDVGLFLDLSVDVVEITGGLERSISETAQRSVSIRLTTLLDVPTRRFWAEVNTNEERDCRNHRRSQLQSPCDRPDVVDRQIGAEPEENTERSPHLPTHDQSTSNSSWAVLCGVDWYGGSLSAHTNTEKKTRDEELRPGLSESGSNDR